MRDYRQKHIAEQRKGNVVLEADSLPTRTTTATTRQSSSRSSPAPTASESDSTSSSDNSATMLLRDGGAGEDPVLCWPSEWESALLEVEALTISPPSSPPGTKAALTRQPQKGFRSPGFGPCSKPVLVDARLPLNASPGNGAGDPFDALPSTCPDASELIHHCMSTYHPGKDAFMIDTYDIVMSLSLMTMQSTSSLGPKQRLGPMESFLPWPRSGCLALLPIRFSFKHRSTLLVPIATRLYRPRLTVKAL